MTPPVATVLYVDGTGSLFISNLLIVRQDQDNPCDVEAPEEDGNAAMNMERSSEVESPGHEEKDLEHLTKTGEEDSKVDDKPTTGGSEMMAPESVSISKCHKSTRS